MFESVLFPIDPTREDLSTAEKAIELARKHDSHLILLAIKQMDKPEINNEKSIDSLLKKVKEEIEKKSISCEVMEQQGKPAFVICDVADELSVDLIVMGTRGINLQEDNKSTAAQVIQFAPCPVLVVP